MKSNQPNPFSHQNVSSLNSQVSASLQTLGYGKVRGALVRLLHCTHWCFLPPNIPATAETSSSTHLKSPASAPEWGRRRSTVSVSTGRLRGNRRGRAGTAVPGGNYMVPGSGVSSVFRVTGDVKLRWSEG